jgi:hypothetical protein
MPRRRELAGIACAIAGSFASRNNDVGGYWALGQLYRRAKEVGSLQVKVGLMPYEADRAEAPMASIGSAYRKFLNDHLNKRMLPDSWVASALVTVQFESATPMPELLGKHAGCRPFQCEVMLVDDLAREHRATSNGWCWPHDPARETQSTRAW